MPDISTITETKLKEGEIYGNILLKHRFVHVDSARLAGGVAFYEKETLVYNNECYRYHVNCL